MKLRMIAFAAFWVTASLAAEVNRLTREEVQQGWVLLFDGQSTKGWEEVTGKPFPTNCWTVEDGSLKAFAPGGGLQDIRTLGTFRSFELQFDWKMGRLGNSGVKYLVQRSDEWTNKDGRQARARGLEYQLADDANPDAASDPRRVAASLYSVIAPNPHIAPKIDVFNHSRLIVQGTHVEHWLNGSKLVSFDITDPEVAKLLERHQPKGHAPGAPIERTTPISLQNHGSVVWFQNVKIRPLPGK